MMTCWMVIKIRSNTITWRPFNTHLLHPTLHGAQPLLLGASKCIRYCNFRNIHLCYHVIMEIFGHSILQSWKNKNHLSSVMKFWSNFPIIINRMWFLNPILLQITQYIYNPWQVRSPGSGLQLSTPPPHAHQICKLLLCKMGVFIFAIFHDFGVKHYDFLFQLSLTYCI